MNPNSVNNTYTPPMHPMPYRMRGAGGSANDLTSAGTPQITFSPLHPPTPPLIFTPQFGSTPPNQQDPLSSSPYVEPLQVNYQAVLGRRNSSTTIELEDSPITVTCRTKGTGRSPYITPIQADVSTEAERVGRHNPYTFSYSGNSSPVQVSTPTQGAPLSAFNNVPPLGSGMMDPYTAEAFLTQGHSNRLDTGFELPPEVVHRALKDRCRYIQFPANLPSNPKNSNQGNTNGASGPAQGGNANGNNNGGGGDGNLPIALFIGQVRFETTPAELLWLIHRTCGACASHLESRGAGCYLLYCRSEADLTLVRSLHKRILFDIGGVWLARTADEVDALCEHVALDAPLLSKKARLPRDSMVVEELKADALNSSAGSGGGVGRRGGHGGGGSNNNNSNQRHGQGGQSGAAGAGAAEKRTSSSHAFGNNRRGNTNGPPQGSMPRDETSPRPEQHQSPLPSYQDSAPPYPGYAPQPYMDRPPY